MRRAWVTPEEWWPVYEVEVDETNGPHEVPDELVERSQRIFREFRELQRELQAYDSRP